MKTFLGLLEILTPIVNTIVLWNTVQWLAIMNLIVVIVIFMYICYFAGRKAK